jgi:hypothetical protein
MPTTKAPLRFPVTGRDLRRFQIPPHGRQSAQQLLAQLARVVQTEERLAILEVPTSWAPAILLLHEQAIGSQLEDIPLVRLICIAVRLDLYRDDPPSFFHQVVRFACQTMLL